jgi:hypothetical protein
MAADNLVKLFVLQTEWRYICVTILPVIGYRKQEESIKTDVCSDTIVV